MVTYSNLIESISQNTTDYLIQLANRELIKSKLYNHNDVWEKDFVQERIVTYWLGALKGKDPGCVEHSHRVAEMMLDFGNQLDASKIDKNVIRWGALLHDMGKIMIPTSILNKASELDADEWAIMKKHPEYAYNMMSEVEFLKDACEIPFYHHERWDGKGYPCRLIQEEIPVAVRIFTVIDVWDALTSHRSYRSAWTRDEALGYLKSERGGYFDPEILDAFVNYISQN